MFRYHKPIERNASLLLVLILIVVSIGGLVEIAPSSLTRVCP